MNRHERRAQARARAERQHGVPAAIVEAIRRHQAGDLATAEAAYVAELATNPTQPETLHFLGVLRYQQQRAEEGIALVRRSLARAPDYVDAWNNLGNMYKETGQLQQAEGAYKEALARDFNHTGAWNNLGVVLRAQDRAPEAVGALRQAVKCAPAMTEAHINLGNALSQCQLPQDAIAAFRRALETDPSHARAHKLLARTLYLAGQREDAEAVFRSWQTAQPGNAIAVHMLAACSGQEVPARASDDFVRTTFDEFAESFDDMLLHRLEYHAPELLVAAMKDAIGLAEPVRDVLDAGCGTGLCGVLLKPFARTLIGVDLSERMLRKARARAIYDELIEDELTRYLDAHPAAYDMIASADTLCYFGEIGPVVAASARALRHGGWLGFTVERADDVDRYRINPHGRYSHARGYVSQTLSTAGLDDVRIEPVVLRVEMGQPVNGWVVLGRRS